MHQILRKVRTAPQGLTHHFLVIREIPDNEEANLRDIVEKEVNTHGANNLMLVKQIPLTVSVKFKTELAIPPFTLEGVETVKPSRKRGAGKKNISAVVTDVPIVGRKRSIKNGTALAAA